MTPTPARLIGGLYVIVDPDACRGRNPVEIAGLALEGGASIIQWRDKKRDKGDQLADARSIRGLCRQYGALYIINDHADLAVGVGADGVHLGQHDLPVAVVRPIVGLRTIIGVSTNDAAEARAAEAAGAGYVAVGSIFATHSKDVTRPASLDRIREVREAVGVPVIAIGGISAANIRSVIQAGADGAAVISAVCAAADPRAAAADLAAAVREWRT